MNIRALIPVLGLVSLDAAAAGNSEPPGFYEGVLPCADCAGIRYRLELRPDLSYLRELTYLGRPEGNNNPSAVLGVWSESADRKTLELRDMDEPPAFFAIRDGGVLRKLDGEGRPIESKLNYELLRKPAPVPFEPLIRLQGMYSYMADAGTFRECLTRLRLPVASERDNAALEKAYVGARGEPGQELLVTAEGRIGQRAGMEGSSPQEVLVVERFINIWPGESCGDPLTTASLANTYWKLTRLGEEPVVIVAGRREPNLRLQARDHNAAGFGGCNNFMGSYHAEGANISFGRIAATMMACPDTMEQERKFLDALEAARRWNILGEHLELYDKKNKLLARFEARYMK